MAAATSELKQLIAELSEDQARQVTDYARFLRWRDEHREWHEFGRQQFAKAYGDDEPEYTLADRREESES